MQAEPIRLSVVVPCHNEAEALALTVRRIAQACGAAAYGPYEIILIDDGSEDRTWDEMVRLRAGTPEIRALRLSRNFGHQAALTAGLRASRGSRVFVLDADLQDPPENIGAFWAKVDEGFDVAYGLREARQGETLAKRLSAWAFYRLLNYLSEIPLPVDSGDFRLMTRRAVNAFLSLPEQGRFVRGMVAWIGFRQAAVPYVRAARHAGTTKYSLQKMLRFAAEGITSFSIRPLRLGIVLGGLMLLVSCGLLVWVMATWLFGYTVRGWSSMLVVMLAIGGVQTLLLGVIGEYVGRLFVEAKGRPLYIISDSLE